MSENKNSVTTPKAKAEKKSKIKGGFMTFMKSRKAHHGAASIGIIAVVIAIVIVINVVCGLLVDRFPDIKLDLTANNSFALQDDTVDYMAHLDKEVEVFLLMSEDDFSASGTYFVQAQNLLEKMEGNSNGKLKVEYVDLVDNPTFTSKYPDIDWSTTTSNYVALVVCGEQYKALTLEECFTYDEEYYSYYQQYYFTGTTIEQAVVTSVLNVTTEDKVVVDIIKGNNESDYTALKTLLSNNAYQVNEVSLVTQEIDEEAEFIILFAPSVDLDEGAVDKIAQWLDNNGKYGRTLVYVPCADKVDTPNIDQLLDDWGMAINGGYVFETSTDYLVTGSTPYAFVTNYSDYYMNGLKNPSIPVFTTDSHDIIIEDTEMAHALLTTSSDAGVYPYDADEDWNYEDAIVGEPLNIAAEGVVTNNDKKSSRVIVFGSYMMFNEQILGFNSYNNSAYFMNVMNTIADKDDTGITIESKTLESTELGVTDVTTKTIMMTVFVIIIPVVILIAGLVVWLRRRNK